jgi:hypothetical protein
VTVNRSDPPPDVLPSGLGDLGGATGAALLAADALAVHA